MHFLLTNDDGIDAPGLATLERVARQLGQVTIVAPDGHLSGCSHQTTTHRPLRVEKRGENRFAIDGTPADCVRLGLLHLAPAIDWVLSGVNDGGNLGVDVYMSGTVAAAREATLFKRPAIALSQYRRTKHAPDWDSTAKSAYAILIELLAQPLPTGQFWNVNFPDLGKNATPPEGGRQCELDPHPLNVVYDLRDGLYHYQSTYHDRRRRAGSDVDVCFNGQVAITCIHHASE